MEIQHIQELIAKGDIKWAISALEEGKSNLPKELKDLLLNLENRFNTLENQNLYGVLDSSAYMQERNKISKTLIEILAKIEEKEQGRTTSTSISASTKGDKAKRVYEHCKDTIGFFKRVEKDIEIEFAKGDYDDSEFAVRIEEYEKKLLDLRKKVHRLTIAYDKMNKRQIENLKKHISEDMQAKEIDDVLNSLPDFEKYLHRVIKYKFKEVIFIGTVILIGLLILLPALKSLLEVLF
ncbi:MAG: hypothetical protein DYG98_01900 [Haliscomenobacteraceae bacterium CHB4]|nr:hypothetical protein [Haliscomenobacteraceae bacterium CHB4]